MVRGKELKLACFVWTPSTNVHDGHFLASFSFSMLFTGHISPTARTEKYPMLLATFDHIIYDVSGMDKLSSSI